MKTNLWYLIPVLVLSGCVKSEPSVAPQPRALDSCRVVKFETDDGYSKCAIRCVWDRNTGSNGQTGYSDTTEVPCTSWFGKVVHQSYGISDIEQVQPPQ